MFYLVSQYHLRSNDCYNERQKMSQEEDQNVRSLFAQARIKRFLSTVPVQSDESDFLQPVTESAFHQSTLPQKNPATKWKYVEAEVTDSDCRAERHEVVVTIVVDAQHADLLRSLVLSSSDGAARVTHMKLVEHAASIEICLRLEMQLSEFVAAGVLHELPAAKFSYETVE